MKYYASLDENNVVTNVIVVADADAPTEQVGLEFISSLGLTGIWKETAEDGSFRKNYAIIGGVFDPVRDAFISPQPFVSWSLDEETCKWQPPVPYPNDGKGYYWDESTTNWIEVVQ